MKLLHLQFERHYHNVHGWMERRFGALYDCEPFLILFVYSHVGNDIANGIRPLGRDEL